MVRPDPCAGEDLLNKQLHLAATVYQISRREDRRGIQFPDQQRCSSGTDYYRSVSLPPAGRAALKVSDNPALGPLQKARQILINSIPERVLNAG